MKSISTIFLSLALCLGAFPASAALRVMACEPEWGALVQEIAGDKVSVYVATTGLQDPHHVQARPSLVAAARNANLVVCTGAELEIGWLPLLISQSANPAIQPGQPGYFEAAAWVKLLDVPTRLDRADGDVHAAGNPHFVTDPRTFTRVAAPLAARLAQLDPDNATTYQARSADFLQRWNAAIARWEQQALLLKGTPIVVQHKAFPYLEQWLGLVQVAALEPKPGVEPSTAYLSTVLATLNAKPARMILRAAYNDDRAAVWLAGRTQLPVVTLAYTVGGNEQAKNLFSLFDDTIQKLMSAKK